MRIPVLLSLACLLAACATPRQECLNTATRDLRVVNELIAETRATVERGYAVRREPTLRRNVTFCYGGFGNHVGINLCNDTVLGHERVAQAVDLDAERAKLASLIEKRAALRARAQSAVTDCRARFPAEG